MAGVTNAEKIKAAIREAIDKPQGELTKAYLEKVAMLFIKRKQLTSVSGLTGLMKLEVLGLDGNRLIDISPLAGLTQLKGLHLNGNQLTDDQLKHLAGLKGLRSIDLRGISTLTKAEVDKLKEALPKCSISSDFD